MTPAERIAQLEAVAGQQREQFAVLLGQVECARLAKGGHNGADHLSALSFVATEGALLVALLVYLTIAVVCTRLANGGFLRFTLPAGNGRVTV